jgi:ATP-dependent helicase HrpA
VPPRYAFLDHNSQLRQKIEIWQTQARQRLASDLDALLVEAYAERLPKVSSVAELDRVLRQTLGASPEFLRFTARDWLGPRAAAFEAGEFPDRVKVGEQSVEVRYAYAPGEERDGITLRLPFTLAQVIDPGLLDWAVAGLREQQVLHLLQALPKAQRRTLMPLAPKAAELAQALQSGPAGLVPALAALVRERYGADIPANAWSLDSLPAHLRPRIEVLDADAKPLATGRDLRQVRTQVASHDPTAGSRPWQEAVRRWERYDLRAWDCGDLPERIHVEDVGGFPLYAFPALHLEEGTLAVRLFRHAEEAAAAHATALPPLADRVLEREWAWLQKDLKALTPIKPHYVTLGPGDELTSTAFDNIRRHLLAAPDPAPRTAAAFDAWIQGARVQLPGLVMRFAGWVGEILNLRQALLLHRKPYPGMRADLDALLPSRFLDTIPMARLVHVPRYLKAMALRADRAAVNPAKDAEKLRRVQPHVDAWRQAAARAGGATDAGRARIEELRWLLEEFRVSTFAQELGTAEPVSPKRLDETLQAALK